MSTFMNTDPKAFSGVWVFCEQRQGKMMPTTFELISEGRKLADELGVELGGILLGDNVDGIAKELGGYGADEEGADRLGATDFADGQAALPKIGRNDPCPCGSGKKYKHCHGQLG